MANFCAKCGATLVPGARFCAECGAPAAEPTGQGSSGPTDPGGAGPDVGGLPQNIAAALCYIPVIGIAFLFIDPYRGDAAIRFHAWQSIFFTILWVAIRVSFRVLGFGFGAVNGVIWLAFFVVWIVLLVKAYGGEKWKLPVIGDLAEQQAAKG